MAPKHVFGTLICFFLASQPVFSDVSFVYEGTDTRAWCNFQSCSAQKDYNIVVGQNLDVNISATSNQTSLSNVTMTLLNIAGLPNGCQIFEEFHLASYIMDYTLNETVVHWYTMRRVLFTPRAGQEGLSYQVCFMASNSNITSTSMCFHIHVVAPVVQFLPTLPNSSFEIGVNCPLLLHLLPFDASGNGYCMGMSPGTLADPSKETLPWGAELRRVGTVNRTKLGEFDGCDHSEFLLSWYPRRGTETQTFFFCVHAYDTVCIGYLCQQRGKELCFSVFVKKCRYCLSIGETIMGAAARYNSDWLQEYFIAPPYSTPFSLVPPDLGSQPCDPHPRQRDRMDGAKAWSDVPRSAW
mmetsp:Transcript_2964/g.7136  ORF Transcript_2964/g.7136 Transcript_2964/m.7136 type:complete len:353 (-) Transcript_2964:378-1436(-)